MLSKYEHCMLNNGNSVHRKYNFCTQKLQRCSKTEHQEFCAHNIEILSPENRNFVLKNGNSLLRKWKFFPYQGKSAFLRCHAQVQIV